MRRLIIPVFAVGLLVSNAPAPKKERVGALKDEIGQLYGELIKQNNDTILACARLNQTFMQELQDLIEGERLFANPSKEDLQKKRDQLKKQCI
ncbi:hypothetical protein HYX58_03185 [Candidatus Dependentiae bacterium]|nr:hypothetical protein [Candidatus Dependentiae bacterium]